MYAGLLPKLFSPTHYLKKAGIMPKGKKAVEEPTPAIDPAANPQGQMILLGVGGLALALILFGGNRR